MTTPSTAWHIESHNGTRYLYKGLVEWMCDDFQRRTVMDYYASLAHGRTLIGGLGLGLLTDACQKNDNITQVVTVESDASLILFSDLDAVWGDVWEVALRSLWDTIILDLWPDVAEPTEDLTEKAATIREANPGVTLIIHGYPSLSDC